MSQLRIYFAQDWQDASSVCTWALLDDARAILQSGSDALANMPKADECIAVVDAAQVLCVARLLPKIKASQLETALPLALEEMMLGEASEQHVVPGALTADGKTVLYALDKTKLRQFLSACAAAQIRVQRMLPEFSLLPVQVGEWSLAWDGQRGCLTMPQHQGLYVAGGDSQQAPVALSLQWQAAQGAVQAVRLFSSSNQIAPPQWQGISLTHERERFDWRSAALNASMPNLLWGKFAPPLRIQAWLPKIKPLLWIVALVLGIEAVGYNLQWMTLAHEKTQIKQSMTRVFQETFGSEVEVVDAPLQMQRSLARARHAAGVADDADFLTLLDRVSEELIQGAASKVNGLRYADGQLDVEVKLADRANLAALQQRLSEQGLHVTISDVNDSGSEISAHLRIASGGGR
jgi:general secretion pathway protein L